MEMKRFNLNCNKCLKDKVKVTGVTINIYIDEKYSELICETCGESERI